MLNFTETDWCMNIALEEADKAYKLDEVPVGAVITDSKGSIIGKAHNVKEAENDPTGHAEILAIKQATKAINGWRLTDCSIYITLEPCLMCASAIQQARIKNVYFGAYDPKGGFLSLNYYMHIDKRLNHELNVYGGINHYKCSNILSTFFKHKRLKGKKL